MKRILAMATLSGTHQLKELLPFFQMTCSPSTSKVGELN